MAADWTRYEPLSGWSRGVEQQREEERKKNPGESSRGDKKVAPLSFAVRRKDSWKLKDEHQSQIGYGVEAGDGTDK
jgi:hypothetical protein